MKDYLYQELNVGDYVVFRTPSYSSISIGKIITFTPQKVRVEHWQNYGINDRTNLLVDPDAVAKISAEFVELYFKNNPSKRF